MQHPIDHSFQKNVFHSRKLTPEQTAKFTQYISEIFKAAGMNPDSPGTVDTPKRFLKAIFEITRGYEGDDNIFKLFPVEKASVNSHDQIIQGPISFFSLCEHHALPFFGHVYLAYIPHQEIIGISKMMRLVNVFARRFSLQERLSHEIADAFEEMVKPKGLAVHIKATHLCARMRGVNDPHSFTVTTIWRGVYEAEASLRREFLEAAHSKNYAPMI